MDEDFEKYRAETIEKWDKADFEGKLAMMDEAIKAKILGDPNSIGQQMAEIRERDEVGAPREGDQRRWNQLAAMVDERERQAQADRSGAADSGKPGKQRSTWDYDR